MWVILVLKPSAIPSARLSTVQVPLSKGEAAERQKLMLQSDGGIRQQSSEDLAQTIMTVLCMRSQSPHFGGTWALRDSNGRLYNSLDMNTRSRTSQASAELTPVLNLKDFNCQFNGRMIHIPSSGHTKWYMAPVAWLSRSLRNADPNHVHFAR